MIQKVQIQIAIIIIVKKVGVVGVAIVIQTKFFRTLCERIVFIIDKKKIIFFPIINSSPVVAIIIGLSVLWLLTYINSRGVKEAGWVQLITTILKLVPLILMRHKDVLSS